MTREEAIEIIKQDIPCEHDNDLIEALDMAIKALEQEPCEDDYIRVPKKALKYRTAGMVAYNAEWIKNHFDIERDVICGAQQPILDKIRTEIEQAADKQFQIAMGVSDLNERYAHIQMENVDIRPIKPCPYLLPCGICDRKELQTDDPITSRMCSQYLPEGRIT